MLERLNSISPPWPMAHIWIIFNKLNATTKKHTPWDGEIKVALVGCGGRGTGAAIQAIAADQDVRLVAIADVFEDQTEKCMQALVEKYGESELWDLIHEKN